jgi:hypothetical protein
MTSHVTETRVVKATGNPVTLAITVGFAQVGGSYVLHFTPAGTAVIKPNAAGVYSITPQANDMLSCVTTVQDINPSTNNTAVTHDFTNLNPAGPFSHSRAVQHHNDKVVYDILYVFN